ncbi:two-component system response regulator [bacterium]|nr:two-component system response regulator [bacterium]|tara:strand:- start:5195 stop:6628 length:1434 start_codon:yes stop_codon:yes gene_type:complete
MTSQKLPHYPLDDTQRQAIVSCWLKQLSRSPHFASTTPQFHETSHQFLSNVLHATANKSYPSVDTEALSESFSIWHTILSDLRKKGFTTRDSALLIFSLKSGIADYLNANPNPALAKITPFLDLFARLTFEIYSAEHDDIVQQQSDQIAYLQDHKLTLSSTLLASQSPTMATVYKAIGLILENDVTVLLQGESGTGKDVLARLIHSNSSRKGKPFITINCGAIPKDLIESELFGHEKGAFTGAEAKRLGKFELANGGTLFLDEIGELSLDLQVKLLRVIQNRTIERLGGSQSVPVDVRIVAATHIDLDAAVHAKTFRLDLFYRLNVYPILVPALRNRNEDIIPLANFFIKLYCDQFKLPLKSLGNDAKAYLLNYAFPGNIRELENLIQRAVIMSPSTITALILQTKPGESRPIPLALSEPRADAPSSSEIVTLADLESAAIQAALKKKSGNVKQTADALGISRTTLYNKAKRYEIPL